MKAPANTPDPFHHGVKRVPSSLVHTATSSGRRVWDAVVVEAAADFERRHHAVAAIEAPARGLGVEMAAAHHRRGSGILAGTAGEDVAHAVDTHRQARRLAGDELVAAGLVFGGECDALDAALGGGADRPCPSGFATGGRR